MADFTVSRSFALPTGAFSFRALLSGPVAHLLAWEAGWLQRQRLQNIDAHIARDIGLNVDAPSRAAVTVGWDRPLAGLF
ncbi:hypothetical protein HKCCSP123_11340 [Rhodobacterales bacterium HKCCSP123]|nr:hypothetical protein [Rhodobacterales bacterium HKCCSP123]